jgi:type II secretory pathway component GspD/PulD (secretin)
MNRSNLVRSVLSAALAGFALVTWGQQALEIIPLRHRTVEQVLPVLQPLLEPGATLSGSRGQLFLRASPANAAEIKRALEAMDSPSRRLQISVRLDDAAERERSAAAVSGAVGSAGARIGITAEDARRAAAERVDQRLQVLEGGHAFIFTGQSSLERDQASGFEVVPRISGDLVHLDIAQQRESGMQSQRLSTSVTARLGEWVEIGGSTQGAARDDRTIGAARSTRTSEARRVWLKVEEVPN